MSSRARPIAAIRQRGVCGIKYCECGRQLKTIAAIEELVVIERMLTHLGLPARAPPRAPAREPSLNHAA
jgi:hypothetical protein